MDEYIDCLIIQPPISDMLTNRVSTTNYWSGIKLYNLFTHFDNDYLMLVANGENLGHVFSAYAESDYDLMNVYPWICPDRSDGTLMYCLEGYIKYKKDVSYVLLFKKSYAANLNFGNYLVIDSPDRNSLPNNFIRAFTELLNTLGLTGKYIGLNGVENYLNAMEEDTSSGKVDLWEGI